MIRNRVSWGFGLMALLVLTFGMAACGGSEPAPVVQPPAPPPAPPPFQPQAVEVALGEAGGNITLMTTESGGFTLNGELFESGGSVTAENGNTYLLVLADGNWNAAFQAMEIMVTLGITEETVALTQAEDGTYWLGDMAVQSGVTMATATNGNVYTLMITTDDAGMIAWTAAYVEPVVNVPLGLSGDIAMIKKSEDGSYWLGDITVESGETMATAANGNTYTLSMADGEWSAAYVAMTGTVAIGGTGLAIDAVRDEAGSWTAVHPLTGETIALTEGGMVAAGDNQYMLSSDGAGSWTAAYVAYSAPVMLGTSGPITLVRAEDGTYWHGDALVENGSTVTAMNGNEYTLTMADGEWSAAYVAYEAMVMLGASGTTIALTRAEDGTYWHGDALVENGSMATAVNGNTYTLTMADGEWTAMYNASAQTVALGSSGSSATVMTEEDGSYSVNGMAIASGGEVAAENGNTYMLTLADGAWSADYVPTTMDIGGTGLTAVSLEDGSGYDVDGSTLPVSGQGDVTTADGAMYHVVMDDGELMGTRFDGAIDTTTDFTTNSLPLPALSANDPDTAVNETRANLILTGSAAEGNEGLFSMGALLGGGMASDEGARFVDSAVEEIGEVRSDVAGLLALETAPATLETILETQWSKLEAALDDIFGTSSAADANPDSAVRMTAPREEDILDEIDDILDALSTEDAFAEATAADGRGVFASQELSASAASDAFNRVKWTAAVTMGATGATRYGTAIRKSTDDAKTGLTTEEFGAFSYSTTAETLRTADAAAVSLTGIASYSGGTEAISGKGTTYSGTMDLQVRFAANSVSGVVKDLLDADGLRWQHNFADVDRIVLDDGTLQRNAMWNNTGGTNATVFFTADSGLLRPISSIENTFRGILLGKGADAGSQASGTWSVNAAGSSNYLTGGYGVEHVSDASRPLPGADSGGTSNGALMSTQPVADVTTPTVSIGDGKLTVKVGDYGWAGRGGDTEPPTYQALMDDQATPEPILVTAEFDLETLAASAAPSATTVNGAKHVDTVISTLEAQRDQLATLQGLGTRTEQTRTAEAAAWQIVQDTVAFSLFGGDLPQKLEGSYTDNENNLQDDALDLIDRVLDALSSASKFQAAADPNGTGIFDYFNTEVPDDEQTDADESKGHFISYDAAGDRRYETTGRARPIAAFLGEREYKVIASLGTTNYTRFGIWRRESTESAEREPSNVLTAHGGPGTFAYSPLDPTQAGTQTNPSFPLDGSARYTGETVAVMGTVVLTGTAMVDVSWTAATDLDLVVDGTSDGDSNAGSMTLTLSNLADADGDPLAYTGTIGGATTPGEGYEIADIVFSSLAIDVGRPGGNSGHLLVGTGTEGEGDDVETFTYGEVAPASVRYRLATPGLGDQPGDGALAKALFVGQGRRRSAGRDRHVDVEPHRGISRARRRNEGGNCCSHPRRLRSRDPLTVTRNQSSNKPKGERATAPPFLLCAEQFRVLEGASPRDSLMEVKS